MKKILIVLLLVMMVFAGCSQKSDQVLRSENVAISATDALISRKDDSFYLYLSQGAKSRISRTELSNQIDSIIRIYGRAIEVSDELPESVEIGSTTIVRVPVLFQVGWMDFEYRINEDGSIDDFVVTVSDKLDESAYDEVKGTYEVDGKSGSYVFTKPVGMDESTPVVIFVHDRGMKDRNSTINATRVFRSIAYQLADNGVASLRFDRLSLTNPDVDDSFEQIQKELLSVKENSLTLGVSEKQKVILFGYGLGGYLIPYLSKVVLVDGYIIANAPSRDIPTWVKGLEDMLVDVDTSTTPEQKEQFHRQIQASYDLIDSLMKKEDYTYPLFGLSSSFWLEDKEYDALDVVDGIRNPLLVIAGSNDYLVSNEEYNQWQYALLESGNAELKFYKDMDHYFVIRSSASKPSDTLDEGTLSSAFIKDLVEFTRGL